MNSSSHVSRVFSTAVDLNHLLHPQTDVHPDEEPPSLANRLGAVALLVLSLATLGVLTGFYFYQAHKKVVHLEKAEGRDEVIAHLYRKNRFKEEPKSQTQGTGLHQVTQEENIEARSLLLKGVKASREETLSFLTPHQAAVVKAAVTFGTGKTAKALEQIKVLKGDAKEPLTPDERRELLRIAIGGDQVSVVLDLLQALSAEETGKEKEKSVVESGKVAETGVDFPSDFPFDFPWEEIKSEKMFNALWEKVDKTLLTPNAKKMIASLVLKNEWIGNIDVIKLPDTEMLVKDIQSEKVFDAIIASMGDLKALKQQGKDFLFLIVVKNGWEEKVDALWNALGTPNIPWDKMEGKSEALFNVLWEKQKENAAALDASKKNAIMQWVVKNDQVDKVLPVWTALGEVSIPWTEVKNEGIFDALWGNLPEDKEVLGFSKDSILEAVVRNDWVNKALPIWRALGSVRIPWEEVRSPEMHNELCDSISYANTLLDQIHENLWHHLLLFNVRNVETAKAFKEKGGKSYAFADVTALHTCKDPEVAKYLISKEGFNIWVDYCSEKKPIVALYTTPPAVQKVLIEKGANVNIPHPDGYTLLHTCKDPEMVKLLLEHGAHVYACDAQGRTPLHTCEDPEIMKLLIEYGADPNDKDNIGNTPLAQLTNPKVLRLLAKVEVKHYEGYTLLHRCRDRALAEGLIAHGARIEAKNKHGSTPLISNDSLEVRQLLIEKGANVNAQNNEGWTALLGLCQMARDKYVEIIRQLLVHGADPNLGNVHGIRPLHWTSRVDLIDLLLEHGAKIEIKDEKGNTPLLDAGHRTTAHLIEKGADFKVKNNNGESLLHRWGALNPEIAQMLVQEKGMDINSRDNEGNTPLITALKQGALPLAEKWIELGADVTLVNNEGKTVLHFCRYSLAETEKLIQLFIKDKGRDPNSEDNEGNRPLHGVYSVGAAASFIANGANPKLLNHAGQSLLFSAHNEELLDYFIDDLGLDPAQMDHQGRTCLHTANGRMVSYWVKRGLNINARDNQGKTPLHYCKERWIAESLIKNGADPEIVDNDGKLPSIILEHPDWFKKEEEEVEEKSSS